MNLPVSITRTISRNILVFKKQSPHIFFAAGVIGSITSTVMACRATLKLEAALDEIRQDLDNVNDIKEGTHHAYDKDIAYIYVKGGIQIAKLYGPAVIVGAASITALTGSHVQMTRRNAALMAAYAAVQRAYEDYRDRVRERLGDEEELEIYHAAKKNKLDGKEITVADPDKWGAYAKFFDEYNKNWKKDPELNRLFVQCIQNYCNQRLKGHGHVFLNEVYEWLGFDHTSAGAVVGWVINDVGDNFVDFGVYEAHNALFVTGSEASVLLDFNVDGVIYDKI